MSKTIVEIYGAPVERLMYPDEVYKVGKLPIVSPNLIFGMELEIENWQKNRELRVEGFNYTIDNSLRGSGIEAITHPTKAKFLQSLLETFYKTHKVTANNYTERCSTHVHMNVQNMTFDQIKTLAAVYQTVERLLFGYVGNEREDNVFCVPWFQSGLSPHFVEKMEKNADRTVKSWIKYSALNLLPITAQGTVEFRHLHGTCDVPYLLGWINLLSCMHTYAMENTFEKFSEMVLEMNTISNYDGFMHMVFKEHTNLLMKAEYKDLLSIGVIDTKLMLMKQKGKAAPVAPPPDWFDLPAAVARANEPRPIAPIQARPRRGADEDRPMYGIAAAPIEINWNVPAERFHSTTDGQGRITHHNIHLGGGLGAHAYVRAGWVELSPNTFRSPA